MLLDIFTCVRTEGMVVVFIVTTWGLALFVLVERAMREPVICGASNKAMTPRFFISLLTLPQGSRESNIILMKQTQNGGVSHARKHLKANTLLVALSMLFVSLTCTSCLDDTVERCWEVICTITVSMNGESLSQSVAFYYWGTEAECAEIVKESEKAFKEEAEATYGDMMKYVDYEFTKKAVNEAESDCVGRIY